jgi:hypothetical protein
MQDARCNGQSLIRRRDKGQGTRDKTSWRRVSEDQREPLARAGIASEHARRRLNFGIYNSSTQQSAEAPCARYKYVQVQVPVPEDDFSFVLCHFFLLRYFGSSFVYEYKYEYEYEYAFLFTHCLSSSLFYYTSRSVPCREHSVVSLDLSLFPWIRLVTRDS